MDPIPPRRKGARRRSDIPPQVLAALHEGTLETVTLVEALALDLALVLENALRGSRLAPDARRRAVAAARAVATQGVTRRFAAIGEALHAEAAASGAPELRADLARHPSDTVRAFAAHMVMADRSLVPDERLAATLPFAADPHAFVREYAWTTLRPYVAADLDPWLARIEPWARHEDPNVRRCAIEGTRPRGVWCVHLPALVEDPGRGLRLLEPSRAHPSRYVQTSVANWLNDASKGRPAWTREVCARWQRDEPGPETAWIVRHATRTLRRGSDEPARPGRR